MGDTCSPPAPVFPIPQRRKKTHTEGTLSSPLFSMFGARQEGFCWRAVCSGSNERWSCKVRVGSDFEEPLCWGVCPLSCRQRAVLEIKWVSIKDKTEILVPEHSMKQEINCHSLFCMRKLRHGENQKFTEDSQLHGRSDSDSFTPLLPLIPLNDGGQGRRDVGSRGTGSLLATSISNSYGILKGFFACGNFLKIFFPTKT